MGTHTPVYFEDGILSGNVKFWQDALFNSNPANNFLTVDIFFFAFAGFVWMVIESRRIGMRYVWAYIALGVFVAISFAFPLFLAARERQLSLADKEISNIKLHAADIVGLSLLCLITVGVGLYLL